MTYDEWNDASDAKRFDAYFALAARLAEAERDAARYRHIRENDSARFALQGLSENGPQALDAAIDAAMASETVSEVQK